ncbi:hypothetical protein N1027_18410 [Herbiconiux sp. CPCC 205763]|uniref:DUF4352 domain-containing protein n=1 Tax=Herbiconiux aconitum TaxID=2970913 RepID=A0ABT2GVC1_9MICO|nr:hypothetical protein [Herbiconiux aconitum]MCS5720108.1 hypothetical protein [Herbiconiux aconitum]
MSAPIVADGTPEPSAPARRTPWWRHALNALALVAVLVVAGVVSHTAPTEAFWQSPVPVTGALGEPVTGRNIQATVTRVRAAESVTASTGWTGETTGVWVVVDASVATVVTDYGTLLGTAQLQIGDRVYSASERPDYGTIAQKSLYTGIPSTGPLMFEVPRDILSDAAARDAQIQLAVDSDPRVDSLVVVPVDLTALPVEPSIETDEPSWGAP